MFSTSTRGRRGALGVAASLGLMLAIPAAAQSVVVSAAGPSARGYPAGRSLAAGSKIVLRAGDVLTVLDGRGTRTLRGPGTFGAEASSATASRSFTALVDTQNRRRARTGAVRRPGAKATPPGLWFVDTATSGTFCIVDPATVQLWRADMEEATALTVSDDDRHSASISYAIGQNTVAWPASVPIVEGRAYEIERDTPRLRTRLRFATVSTVATADPVTTFTALDRKGCTGQKQLLIEAMKPADGS